MKIKILLGVLALAVPQLLWASDVSSTALEIFRNSSAEIRVEQFAPEIRKKYMNIGVAAPAGTRKVRSQILGAIEVAYHPKTFQRYIIESLDESLTPSEQKRIIQWLDTPLGQKSSLFEAKSLVDAYYNGITDTIDHAYTVRTSSLTTSLIDTLDLATMASDLQLDVTINQTSIASFAANAPAEMSSSSHTLFLEVTNTRREEIAKLNKSYSVAVLKNAYAKLSEDELKSLINFWGSPLGSQLSFALRDGINEAFKHANRHFDKEIKHVVSSSTNVDMASF